jgi:hypothetical protein
MVMERMDRDLVSLGKSKPSTKQIAELGLQILDGLKFLHTLGFLFVDVKPDNFMLKEDGKSLCFVDFGCVERWTSYNGAGHREQVGVCGPVGTPNFVSLAMQKGMQVSRIDDVEALCYVLLSLALEGKIPWHSTVSLEDVYARKERTDIKHACTAANVPELAEIILACRAAGRKSEPAYDEFARLLGQLAARKSDGKKTGTAAPATRVSLTRVMTAVGGDDDDGDEEEDEKAESPVKSKGKTKPKPKPKTAAAKELVSPGRKAAGGETASSVYLTVLREEPFSLAVPVASSSRGAALTVGRDSDEASSERHLVIVGDEFISEKHLEIRAVSAQKLGQEVNVAILDTSRNGVRVDGAKIGSGWVALTMGSVIKIGRTEMRVDAEPVPATLRAKSAAKRGGKVARVDEVVVSSKRSRK